jgi:hypothetical protein
MDSQELPDAPERYGSTLTSLPWIIQLVNGLFILFVSHPSALTSYLNPSYRVLLVFWKSPNAVHHPLVLALTQLSVLCLTGSMFFVVMAITLLGDPRDESSAPVE